MNAFTTLWTCCLSSMAFFSLGCCCARDPWWMPQFSAVAMLAIAEMNGRATEHRSLRRRTESTWQTRGRALKQLQCQHVSFKTSSELLAEGAVERSDTRQVWYERGDSQVHHKIHTACFFPRSFFTAGRENSMKGRKIGSDCQSKTLRWQRLAENTHWCDGTTPEGLWVRHKVFDEGQEEKDRKTCCGLDVMEIVDAGTTSSGLVSRWNAY